MFHPGYATPEARKVLHKKFPGEASDIFRKPKLMASESITVSNRFLSLALFPDFRWVNFSIKPVQ